MALFISEDWFNRAGEGNPVICVEEGIAGKL